MEGLRIPVSVDLRVIISMMLMCDEIVVVCYNGRRAGLSNAPLDMEYDNKSLEC